MKMVLRNVVLLSIALALVAAGQSPHSDLIDELIARSESAGRISDNILEDARLDAPELIQKYGYPLEEHTVTTEDGYILTMHRIPHGRDQNNQRDSNKPVAFLMHGILSSSADWILKGPGCSLGYILAEEGFDVWMGNARGNYYSRKHLTLNPDALLNTAFWEFSWDEIGNLDLPAMIDYILEYTGHPRLHYVGHSQGTTVFFVLCSLRPEYNEKFISMQALAPVAYMAHNKNLLLNALAPFADNIERLASVIGMGEFMPNNLIMTWAGQAFCMDEVIFQPICSNILFLIGGWNEAQQNTTMLPVVLGHTPAGAALRQIVHYGQSLSRNTFRRYNHGWLRNRALYGSRTPPDYDLSKITTPVFLHYSLNDPLAEVPDVDRLFSELGRPVGKFLVHPKEFTHMDFIWGIDAKTLIYERVVNLMNAVADNTSGDLSRLADV